MLALARTERAHPRVTFRREAMEGLAFPDARFELVVSSLAFHYVRDYRGLVGRVAAWLAPGGVLVFSTEHPIYTARRVGDGGDAWIADPAGERVAWALDRYADEGRREARWFVPGVVRYHRTFATLVNGLLDAGLTLQRVVEPVPGDAWLREHQASPDERRRPMFILFRAANGAARGAGEGSRPATG
jgi:SAM-dependent methyltransferase